MNNKLFTKTFVFKGINGMSVLINFALLSLLIEWESVAYPIIIALGIFFLPRVFLIFGEKMGLYDERSKAVVGKAAKESTSFLHNLGLGIALLSLIIFYNDLNEVNSLIIAISALFMLLVGWTRALILEFRYKVLSGVISKFTGIEILYGLLSFISIFIGIESTTAFLDGEIAWLYGVFILISYLLNRLYYRKFGKKDERLIEMLEKASIATIRYIQSIVFGAIFVIFIIYFLNDKNSLLISNMVLLAYFLIIMWVRYLHIENQNKIIG